MLNADNKKCFACGRKDAQQRVMVVTQDKQLVLVGQSCFNKISAAGKVGYPCPTNPNITLYHLQDQPE